MAARRTAMAARRTAMAARRTAMAARRAALQRPHCLLRERLTLRLCLLNNLHTSRIHIRVRHQRPQRLPQRTKLTVRDHQPRPGPVELLKCACCGRSFKFKLTLMLLLNVCYLCRTHAPLIDTSRRTQRTMVASALSRRLLNPDFDCGDAVGGESERFEEVGDAVLSTQPRLSASNIPGARVGNGTEGTRCGRAIVHIQHMETVCVALLSEWHYPVGSDSFRVRDGCLRRSSVLLHHIVCHRPATG
jgi:hypothetical protein